MKLLVIDLGSYSVKFVEYRTDKKSLQVEQYSEVILDQLKDQFHPDTPLLDKQLEIVEGHLNHKHYDGKIICQIPHSFLTTRFVQIPVANKKKAALMIPFQLEENIPFQLHQCHVVSEMYKNNGAMDAVVHISSLDEFESFYRELGEREVMPALLSPESSFIQSYVLENDINKDNCFLDIGHHSSKAYYFAQGRLSSRHIGHLAGKHLTEVIAQTYQIPLPEAAIYKHDNCFFLTENQYAEVDEDQRDFANIMKQAVWPLVQDLRRWDLGFRVKHGRSIQKIYLMGGTTKIKNFANFLSQSLELEIEILNVDHLLQTHHADPSDNPSKAIENNPQFLLPNLMAASQFSKHQPVNFLTAQYSSGFNENIPIHSSGFLAARVLFLSLLILLGLTIENIVLKARNKKISKTIETIVKKSSDLKFSKKQVRALKKNKNLSKTLKVLQKRNKGQDELMITLSKLRGPNALSALTRLTSITQGHQLVDMLSFENKEGVAKATFTSSVLEELRKLKTQLDQSSLENKEMSILEKQKKLEFIFRGNF